MRQRRAIVRSGLADQVYDDVRERILDLEYAPEERLVIDRIARQLTVSVTPVRDALNRLAAERLIDFTPFRGFAVLPEPTLEEIAQSFEARECIEAFAAGLGCERATEREIDGLEALHERIVAQDYGGRSGSFSRFVRLNEEFHELLVSSSGNLALVEARRALYHDALVARTMHGRGVPDLGQIDVEHRAILDAFRARDARALEAATVAHIRDGAARVLAASGQPNGTG